MAPMADRVVVTGASGGIGSRLVERLAELGYDVLGLDRKPPRERRFPWAYADLADLAQKLTRRVGDRTEVYEVRETIVVEPTDLWVVDQTQERTFTLIACHPKGSAAQRIVVKGDHVATVPKP